MGFRGRASRRGLLLRLHNVQKHRCYRDRLKRSRKEGTISPGAPSMAVEPHLSAEISNFVEQASGTACGAEILRFDFAG